MIYFLDDKKQPVLDVKNEVKTGKDNQDDDPVDNNDDG